jgi:hypothetical protein
MDLARGVRVQPANLGGDAAMQRIIGRSATLAAAIAAFGAAAAQAQTSAPRQGDFIGTLNNPGLPLTVGIHLRSNGAGETATIDVAEFGSRGGALTNASVTGAKLHFDDPDAHAQYDATWDEAAHRWNGSWTVQNGQAATLNLAPGVVPPLPRIEGLDGDWQGQIIAGPTVLHLVLHVRTGADGTSATLDSPDQGSNGLPVLVGRDGKSVSVNMAIVAARYQGELSDDGSSIKGNFSRGQLQLPLSFTRAGKPG